MTEGQRLLLLVTDSLSVVGGVAGSVSRETVRRWRYGERVPEEGSRKCLKTAYGIPVEAWDQAPRPPAPELAPLGPADDTEPPLTVEVPSSSADHFFSLMAEVRRNRAVGRLSSSERERSIEREGSLRAQYDRALAADKSTEALVVLEHPRWARFEEALMRSLSSFPEAMRQVKEALELLR